MIEQLAFKINFPEEIDCKQILTQPLPQIVSALQTYSDWEELLHNLPDLKKEELLAI